MWFSILAVSFFIIFISTTSHFLMLFMLALMNLHRFYTCSCFHQLMRISQLYRVCFFHSYKVHPFQHRILLPSVHTDSLLNELAGSILKCRHFSRKSVLFCPPPPPPPFVFLLRYSTPRLPVDHVSVVKAAVVSITVPHSTSCVFLCSTCCMC